MGALSETNSSESVKQIEFAMLIGDKDRMGEETKSVYSETGLAHILAVSGLHIGFVVAIIYAFVNKLLKNKHWTSLIVTGIFIAFYLYLCDFAVSAVRAVLMTIVVLYAKARGKQYDSLCGLSLAGILILLINPFDLFDVGFQLSFAVVFSLFCLAPPIGGLLSNYMPEKLASALAVCVSAFIGSVLIVAYYFKNCSLLAILSNLIIIPVVSVSFTALFATVILAIFIPPLKVLLEIPNVLFECINTVAYSISELGISAVLFSTNTIGVVPGLIAIFILSDFIFLSRKQKVVVVGIMVCLIGMTAVYSSYRILEEMAEVSHYEIY
ncbi:MAG: ComEC/Rec2 family competence protein [Clostridia bacterium]|nr:ComEC/Rec2 family competence protein [Clostridia bacterium]